MYFALLGDHPDGLDMARALAETGRHHLAVLAGISPSSPRGAAAVRRLGFPVKVHGDIEEVLADPSVEAVIVAGRPADRPAQLRRALQSERHVLCVHPADQTPDIAYEAALIQGDTGCVLLPLLPEFLHPGVARLADLVQNQDGLGKFQFLEMERWSCETLLLETRTPGQKPAFPGWDVLRRVGGEVAEVSGFAADQEVKAEEPVLVNGRFERGGLFRITLLPRQPESRFQIRLVGSQGRADLIFPQGWSGPARLTWRDTEARPVEENWEAWNPWPALVDVFEVAVSRGDNLPAARSKKVSGLSWHDAVRCLELDDAARRSVERRRSSTLEYQEASEEVGFKGTMTLAGCALLWGLLLLLVLSYWFPRAGWAIVPMLLIFLVLQLLRWVFPSPVDPEKQDRASKIEDNEA